MTTDRAHADAGAAVRRAHDMAFGARLLERGAQFRLWAPSARSVDLILDGGAPMPMTAAGEGWYALQSPAAQAGSRYAFRVDGGLVVPDPASRFNPDDVHQACELIDPRAFAWRDGAWRGRPWHEAVIYELHVGTFTREGTFDAVVGRLDELVAQGITAIELMPVADFPGRRNWGYDGVLLFAPDASYGRPEALKRLIDEAHARNLMVLLDVVYNHFGPDGNYLHAYAAPFFTSRHHTPWGAAINFDGAHNRTVRDFFIANALYWLEEYHADGLRLDAVHAIVDDSPLPIVEEIAQAVRAGPGRTRHVHVVLENDHNAAHPLRRTPDGQPVAATAQWNDDVHHAAHVLLTGEQDGYYVDFAQRPAALLARALAQGFVYQGEPSHYRDGRPRGEPSTALPPAAFINYLQTHDQVGNRAFGDRIAQLADPKALRALYACVLLAPPPPMLFMGEEFAASNPFLFFCDFAGDLAHAVTEGRRAEFRRFARFADPEARARIPDPNAPATFARSKLDWTERERAPHAGMLAFIRELLRLRGEHLVPHLAQARSGRHTFEAPGRIAVEWPLGDAARLHLTANLAVDPAPAPPLPPGRAIYESAAASATLPPWFVRVALDTGNG